MDAVTAAIEQVFQDEYGRVMAALIAKVRDFELAEDALQDALIDALAAWPRTGLPARPAAWLTAAAHRRAIDRLRRAAAHKRGGGAVVSLDATGDDEADGQPLAERLPSPDPTPDEALMITDDIPDERLALIFTCCHPALAVEAQVALTLRTLGGLATDEIARAFLVSEPTMAQRLTRARAKIRDAGIPYRVPPAHLLAERLPGVLSVLYLIFNEGYLATRGAALLRRDLCEDAITVCRVLVELMGERQPITAEARGLLALMLLHDARRAARTAADGGLVLLDDQDRALWDRVQIAEGVRILEGALAHGQPGPYQVQAAIAALHAEALNKDATDWAQIAALYDYLIEIAPTPPAEISRVVAISRTDGIDAGLRLLLNLGRRHADWETYVPYHAARAELLKQHGEREAAAEAYTRAIELCHNEPQRIYLHRQRAALLLVNRKGGAVSPPV